MGVSDFLLGKKGEKQPAPEKYIRNTLTNRELYTKAYLIEFYADDEKNPADTFTFSLPPESEELTYTQRKSEAKTFGGLHVDEYGIDAVKIVLSGSTVNQSLKKIYQADKGEKWLSGEEEIYYFRDLLKKYRSIDNLRKKAKGKIVIFDLSKVAHPHVEGYSTPIKNYWQAFPGDFKIRRSNDKPFTYKYSFEFTGVPMDDSSGLYLSPGDPPDLDIGKLGLLQNLMAALLELLGFIDKINSLVNDVFEAISIVSGLIKVLGNIMSYASDKLSGIIDSAGKVVTGFIDAASSVAEGANSIISLPRTVQLKALNVGLDIQNATNRLMKATDSLVKNCRDMFDEDGEYWQIPSEVLDQYAMNNEEFKDSINRILNNAENSANELAAAAKSADIPDVMVGNPDPETGEQRIVLSYGYKSVTLKSTDSLESLAAKYLGGPDGAIDIATYNGVASLTDLEPGAVIKIPITERSKKMENNRIYARRGDRDNYGRDILLTDDGYIVASSSGDYALTGGQETLSQAVFLRLRENVEKRMRINVYGIRTNISDPTAGVAYIISSIGLTVSGDPRVSSVDDIQFEGAGNSLNVNVYYSDVNGAGGNAAGKV